MDTGVLVKLRNVLVVPTVATVPTNEKEVQNEMVHTK